MSLDNQTITDLTKRALDARNLLYSPYSKFRVGCALLAHDGTVVVGANVENASYGGSICAERVAITKAVNFRAIFIASDLEDTISPCGICRQFIREFLSDIPVHMLSGDGKTLKVLTIAELLPLSFGPDQLKPDAHK